MPLATRSPGALTGLLAVLLLAAACSEVVPSPTATRGPTSSDASASARPPSAAPGSGGAGVVATFRVADAEEYRILLTDPEDIAIAGRLLAGDPGETRRIPNGVIVRGGDGDVNTGYSWHIDPATVEFAELTIEVCDGLPSHVEDGSLTGDRFCPWFAEVIDLEPAG